MTEEPQQDGPELAVQLAELLDDAFPRLEALVQLMHADTAQGVPHQRASTLLSGQHRAEYRARLAELDRRVEHALAHGDDDEHGRAVAEREELFTALGQSVGLHRRTGEGVSSAG